MKSFRTSSDNILMKTLLAKTIAISQKPGVVLTGHITLVQLIAKITGVLEILAVLEDPEQLRLYNERAALAAEGKTEKPLSIEEKILEVLGTISTDDVNHGRATMRTMICQHEFQEFIAKCISNNLGMANYEVKNALRSKFYEIFEGLKRECGRMFDMSGANPEIKEKALLLLKMKRLGIEIYEEVDKENEFTLDELKAIYDLFCSISYSNQVLLVAVNTIRKVRLPDEIASQPSFQNAPSIASYDKESRTIKIAYYEDINCLKSSILRAFGRGIWGIEFLFQWKELKSFNRLHWISRVFRRLFYTTKIALQDIRDDFAEIFVDWYKSKESRENLQKTANKGFRYWLLKRKIKAVQRLLKP